MPRRSSRDDSDTACPACRIDQPIDWSKVVQVCGRCGAEYKVIETRKRTWFSFLLGTPRKPGVAEAK